MMKYLSILFFAALMVWTWFIVNTESPVSFETHAGIQNKLAQIIAETIQNKRPNASEISVDKIWTEPMADNIVKAHFSYSFKLPTESGEMTQSQLTGEGLLEHQTDDGSGFDRWRLYNIKTTSDLVKFEEALVITTGDAPAEKSNQ